MPDLFGALRIVAAAATVSASPTPAPVEQLTLPETTALTGYVYYDSRYANNISNLTLRRDLKSAGAIVPYAALFVDYDTRSTAAEAEIYNDDAIVANAGLAASLDRAGFASLFAAGGYSEGLRGQRSYPETRYGFAYWRSYGTSWDSDLPHAQVSTDVTAYSRYAGNVLNESRASLDARLTQRLRAIGGATVFLDTHRDYGNNYAEVFGGLLWPVSESVGLQTVGVSGRYLPRGIDAPENPYYTTIRLELDVSGKL